MSKNSWISFNFNSWKPVAKGITYSKKICKFADFVRNRYSGAEVVAIQEFISGGGKYIEELYNAFGKEYHVIVPPSFDYRRHQRSLLTVSLLKKSAFERYEVKELGKSLPNRVSYVVAWKEGNPWTIVNLYAVQTAYFKGKADWYITWRKTLHDKLWEEVLSEVTRYKTAVEERVVILGDFQESEGPNVQTLKKMGYKELAPGIQTVRSNCFKEEGNIDHIFFSKKAWSEFIPSGFILDSDLLGELSDHCLLAALPA